MVFKKLFNIKKTESDVKTNEKTHQEAPVGQQGQPGQQAPQAVYLEQAMVENARNDNAQSRYKVYQELLFSELLLAVGEQENQEEGSISLVILKTNNNIPFTAAFTSLEAARRWRPEGGNYVTIKGQDLYKMLEGSPVEVLVLNPGSAPFIELPRLEFRQLAAGVIPQSKGSPVRLATGAPAGGDPAAANNSDQPQIVFDRDIFPENIIAILKSVLENHANIMAMAYAFVVPPGSNPDTQKIRTIFVRTEGIEFSEESMNALFANIQEQLRPHEEELKKVPFQFFPIPDAGFWETVHKNRVVIFDKNPPELSEDFVLREDAFTQDQINTVMEQLQNHDKIEAVGIGGTLPPEASPDNGWIRTIFVRLVDIDFSNNEILTELFEGLHHQISSQDSFKEIAFTFRVMQEGGFWIQEGKEKAVLLDKEPPNKEVQMAFPPDVFNEEQQRFIRSVMSDESQIVAGAAGVILPPGGHPKTGWIRTVFIRTEGVEDKAEVVQQFCASVRDKVLENKELFNEIAFEVGVMPHLDFWSALHGKGFVLFDKNPPEFTPEENDVVEAKLD